MWLLRKRRQRSVDDEAWVTGLERGGNRSPVNGGNGGAGLWAELAEAKAEHVARFKQQTLKSVTVTFSPRWVLGLYFAIALLFIPIGSAILAGSVDVRTTGDQRYDDICKDEHCTVRFPVPKNVPNPSYLYYVITDMHQNALKFVASRSFVQLRGMVPKVLGDVEFCHPKLYIKKFENRTKDDMAEVPFKIEDILNPCGLAAYSFFNDSFTLCRDEDCQRKVKVARDGIAWEVDRKYRFRPGKPPHFGKYTNDLLQNESFMVWMRLSAFNRVEKLYARIEEPLEAGHYFMKVENRFNASGWNGTKKFLIMDTKWFGGKNVFLGAVYLATGLAALLVAISILAMQVMYPRRPAHFDPDLLKRELAKLNFEYAHSN